MPITMQAIMYCSFTLPNFAMSGAERYSDAITAAITAEILPNTFRTAINIIISAAACNTV